MRELAGAPVALVMFDLDGTLTDTVPDITVALNAALADLGLRTISESETRLWVGNGARRLCSRAISRDMNGTADNAATDRLLDRFLERYAERVCVDTRIYDGARECLAELRAHGIALACVTNKPERHTRTLLDELRLSGTFDVVVAGDTLPEKKPHPAPLQHVMSTLKISSSASMMVGDSAADVAAARAAGTSCVCVTYGYNHGNDVHALGADAVIDSLGELPGLLNAGRHSA